MKYTTRIHQEQFVGTVRISPKGGDLTEVQAAEVKRNKYGKELIEKRILILDGNDSTAPGASDVSGKNIEKSSSSTGDINLNRK
jgi:hypothetical protein